MKIEIIENTKNKALKKNNQTRRTIILCLLLCALVITLTASCLTRTQYAAPSLAAKPKPTPPDDTPLDKEKLGDLIETLKSSLAEELEDEDVQTQITDKWDERMDLLAGKTAKQVIDLLMADVKSVVKDAESISALQQSFAEAIGNGESADDDESNKTPEPDKNQNKQAPSQANRSIVMTSPLQDMSRFDSIKRTAMPSKTWTFSTKAGQITFSYDGTGGIAEFKPNRTVANNSIAWIQVVRTGGKDRWYGSVADIIAFSKNNPNYVLRTDAVYGFRVDRTKGENSPYYDQTVLKNAETLGDYKLAFDISNRNTTSGETIKFSDNPDAGGGLFRMKAVDPNNTEYRMHFLLSPVNTETGEIYGTVEWGVIATANNAKVGLEPSLITKDIPELKGRDLAFDRWNTIFAQQYKPILNFSKSVYPIPGAGKFWMK